MGAESSSTVTSLQDENFNLNEKCGSLTKINQQFNGNITLKKCNNAHISVTNEVRSVFNCSESETADAMASMVASAQAKATAGVWGIGVSTSVVNATQIINEKLNSECAQSMDVVQNILSNITCEDSNHVVLDLANRYSSSFVCALQQQAKANASATLSASATASSWDPFSGLTAIIEILIIVAAIGGGLTLVLKASANKGSTPATSSTTKTAATTVTK